MESIIDKIFNGNISETERLLDPTISKRNRQLDEAEKKINKLLATMSKEQVKLFEEWRFIENGLWTDEVDRAYTRGFKIGSLLMIEVHNVHF